MTTIGICGQNSLTLFAPFPTLTAAKTKLKWKLGFPEYTPLATPGLARKLQHQGLRQGDLPLCYHLSKPNSYTPPNKPPFKHMTMWCKGPVQLCQISLSCRLLKRLGVLLKVTYCFDSFMVILYMLLGQACQIALESDSLLWNWNTHKVVLDMAFISPNSAGHIICWVQLRVSLVHQPDKVNTLVPLPELLVTSPPCISILLAAIRKQGGWLLREDCGPLPMNWVYRTIHQ